MLHKPSELLKALTPEHWALWWLTGFKRNTKQSWKNSLAQKYCGYIHTPLSFENSIFLKENHLHPDIRFRSVWEIICVHTSTSKSKLCVCACVKWEQETVMNKTKNKDFFACAADKVTVKNRLLCFVFSACTRFLTEKNQSGSKCGCLCHLFKKSHFLSVQTKIQLQSFQSKTEPAAFKSSKTSVLWRHK